jgi:transposase
MPWKECSVVEERLRFVARLLDGEAMTDVCREFGISRKTGYKIFERYKEHGLEALNDRSRRPVRYANQLPQQLESLIVNTKHNKPHWGARKIRELLVRRLDGDVRVPAKSTPFMPFSIGMAWFNACAGHVIEPAELHCRKALRPTIYGAPISKVSSSSATADTAIR